MAASLYDHFYSSSLSVHEVLMYALHGQMINVGRDLGKIIMRPFLMLVTNWAIPTMSPTLITFFNKTYLRGA